jgi:hypothetical protein
MVASIAVTYSRFKSQRIGQSLGKIRMPGVNCPIVVLSLLNKTSYSVVDDISRQFQLCLVVNVGPNNSPLVARGNEQKAASSRREDFTYSLVNIPSGTPCLARSTNSCAAHADDAVQREGGGESIHPGAPLVSRVNLGPFCAMCGYWYGMSWRRCNSSSHITRASVSNVCSLIRAAPGTR